MLGGFFKGDMVITEEMWKYPREEWYFAEMKNPISAITHFEAGTVTPSSESNVVKLVFRFKDRLRWGLIYQFERIDNL